MENTISNNPLPPLNPPTHSRGLVVLVVGLIISGAVLIGALFLVFTLITRNKPAATTMPTIDTAVVASDTSAKSPLRQQLEKLDRPTQGSLKARLVIVEFADFQCPYCTLEFPTIREIVSKYQDKILYIYRQFPVENENSVIISEAGLCAHDQGKFWQFHDRLFTNHEALLSDPGTLLPQLAQQSGLNMDDFTSCLSTEKFKSQVIEDSDDGVALGVQGTPTFFINGNKIEGVVTAQNWDNIITSALKIAQ